MPPADPALVERDGDLALLVKALAHPPAAVVVEGEPGIGKTRLVREALADHGASDPAGTAELVQSIVYTLSRMIEEGLAERSARRLARELLAPYLLRETP